MSCTEYAKGYVIPTGKTYKDYEPDAENFWDADLEGFIELKGEIYEIVTEHIEYNPCDIMNASASSKHLGGYDFEVMFYNGGMCLPDAITDCIVNMTEPSKEDIYTEFEEWFAAHLGYPVNLLKSLRQPDTLDYESAKGNPLYTAFSAWKASRGIDK